MKVFIAAETNDDFTVGAFAVKVSNRETYCSKHVGWTVVEAYLNGLREAYNQTIKESLCDRISRFDVITASSYLYRLINEDQLCRMQAQDFRDPETGFRVIHYEILKELYMYHLFFEERGIIWEVMNEVSSGDAKIFNEVKDSILNVF